MAQIVFNISAPASGTDWPYKTGGVYGEPPSTSGGTVQIDSTFPATMMAPCTISLSATLLLGWSVAGPSGAEVYDAQWHEPSFIWTVRGSPLADFNVENAPVEFQDANIYYGPDNEICIDTPGSYTVDVWVKDPSNGNTGKTSITFTVTGADDQFPGARTICYSTDTGDGFTGKPAGAQEITSLSALVTALEAATQPTRVLFKRGQTVSDLDLDDASSKARVRNVAYVGAWGSGARPILLRPIITYSNDTSLAQIIYTDIDARGAWDPTTESTSGGTLENFVGNTRNFGQDTTYVFHNCSIKGFRRVHVNPRVDMAHRFTFSRCDVGDWNDYGALCAHWDQDNQPSETERSSLAIVGCSFAQNVDALNGGDNQDRTGQPSKTQAKNRHGPTRIADMLRVVATHSYFRSRNGWFGINDDLGNPSGSDNACFRANTDALEDVFYSVSQCIMEGGATVITLANTGASATDPAGNYLFDKIITLATTKTNAALIGIQYSGVTFRNVLAIVFNGRHGNQGGHPGDVFKLDEQSGSTSTNRTSPIRIHNVTAINLNNSTNDDGNGWNLDGGNDTFTNVTKQNNVTHAPSLATGSVDNDLDIATAIAGVASRYKGVAYDTGPLNAAYSTDGQAVPRGTPEATSSAYQSATSGLVAYDDLFGRVRPASPSRGAVEPA